MAIYRRKIPRKKAKLPPHQYCLKLRGGGIPKPPPPISQAKPHLVYDHDRWMLFRNKWKSQFRGPKLWAAAVSGPTIPELQHRLSRTYDRWRYGIPMP